MRGLDFQASGRATGLRSSLHYASTPTLNSTGNSSVDENASTGSSSDYWENNSSSAASSNNDDYLYSASRIFVQVIVVEKQCYCTVVLIASYT